jgi:hypothetical protein
MKDEDAAKMIKMLDETRSEIIESQSLKPLIEQVQLVTANDNHAPVFEAKQASL